MPAASQIKRLLGRRNQLIVFSGVALLCMAAATVLISQVFFQLNNYGSARTDNVQWTTTQLEVDHAKLTSAAARLQTPTPGNLAALRQRVDVLYSRARMLEESAIYQKMLAEVDALPQLEAVHIGLDGIIAISDGSDADIIAQRTELADLIQAMSAPIRQLSVAGVTLSAQVLQSERGELSNKLVHLVLLSVLLLLALLSLLALFWQLYRRYRHRAMENRITLHRLNTILSTSQDAILVVCPSGTIIDGNVTADALFALPASGQSPVMISQILFRAQEDGTQMPISGEKLAASCVDGPNRCTRLTARDHTGREFPIELSTNMASRSGDTVCVAFIRDISHRVAAEAEMQGARDKALAGERAKARFLGMISHEMRTPLNGILGALDLLDDSSLTDEQRQYTQIMQSSGQLVLNQINDALDLTQADGGRLSLVRESFDLDALLDDLVQGQGAQAADQNTVLRVMRPAIPIGRVMGDQNRLHQVLLNLLSNAVKFTRGGQITIEMTRLGAPDTPGDEVEFQISDTGVGIDEDDLPRIFDDFVRLDDENSPTVEGTGLGLGIAKQLVTMMGGTIGAESVRHEGSLFWVRLPLPAAFDITDMPANTDAHPLPLRALNVLVVEDNTTSRFVLHEMLRKDGHLVEIAINGSDGVAAANHQIFDLILMDINMPGIDGIEAAKRIRTGNGPSAEARIVALTAHFMPEHNDRLLSARIDEVCTKPLRRAALRDILVGGPVRERPAAAQAGVDTQVLDQLCAVLPKQNLAALLDDFVAEGSGFIENLPAFTMLDAGQQAFQVHQFAGSAATFGAVALQYALCRAEAAVLAQDAPALSVELKALPGLWRATLAEITSRRDAA